MSSLGLARRTLHAGCVSFRRLIPFALAALLLFVLPVAASAYTLVLRSGRRVTVPDGFKVTPAAVTYEASPGYRVTVWLSNVDFAATERANAEPAGSFVKRIGRETERAGAAFAPVPASGRQERPAEPRVITNKELEPSRLRRQAEEEEYERTRRERGMPSKEELQQRVAEQDRLLGEWAQQMRERRREAELEALRSELARIRLQLGELSLDWSQHSTGYAVPNYYPYFYAPPVQLINVLPFGHRGGFGRRGFGRHQYGRAWSGHLWPKRSFSPIVKPFGKVGGRPRR